MLAAKGDAATDEIECTALIGTFGDAGRVVYFQLVATGEGAIYEVDTISGSVRWCFLQGGNGQLLAPRCSPWTRRGDESQ